MSRAADAEYESRQRKLAGVDGVAQFTRKGTNQTALQTDFDEIDKEERHYTGFFDNINRTQFDNIATFDEHSVALSADDPDGPPEFIHASHIKTAQENNFGDYIIAQAPLVQPRPPRHDTQARWYKMIWDCGVLVCISCVELGKETNCDYYFNPKRGGSYEVGRYLIVTQDLKSNPDDCWALYALKITNRKVKEDRILRLFVCGGKRTWLDNPVDNTFTYRDLAALIQYVRPVEEDAQQQWQRKCSRKQRPPPMLVHSKSGINRAGVYIAATILYKQILHSQRQINKVAVIALIRRMRKARCDVLGRRGHFVMLLRTVLELGAREMLVQRSDTERARMVLHRMEAEIQSRSVPRRRGGGGSARRGGGSARRTPTRDEDDEEED